MPYFFVVQSLWTSNLLPPSLLFQTNNKMGEVRRHLFHASLLLGQLTTNYNLNKPSQAKDI